MSVENNVYDEIYTLLKKNYGQALLSFGHSGQALLLLGNAEPSPHAMRFSLGFMGIAVRNVDVVFDSKKTNKENIGAFIESWPPINQVVANILRSINLRSFSKDWHTLASMAPPPRTRIAIQLKDGTERDFAMRGHVSDCFFPNGTEAYFSETDGELSMHRTNDVVKWRVVDFTEDEVIAWMFPK